MTALTYNQQRLATQAQVTEAIHFNSIGLDRTVYITDIEELSDSDLECLLNESQVLLCSLKATIGHIDTQRSLGQYTSSIFGCRKKYNYVKEFHRSLRYESDCRRARKGKPSAHDKLLIAHELEKRRIFYDLVKQEIGLEKFKQLMERSAAQSNQTHPNPTLPKNRHLWIASPITGHI